MKKHFLFLAAVLALACGAGPMPAQQPAPVFSTDAAAERIPNLDTLKSQLRQYQACTCACGCYAHDMQAQADRGLAWLRQRVAHRRPHEKLALILDIDETTLSNYPEMDKANFEYVPADFNAWIDTAQAKAFPGTLRLFNEALRLHVSVFFITGRLESQREVTERNLRAEGFDHWQQLILRPAQHGKQTIGAFKAQARAQLVAQGYTLALNAGDQWSDLKGQPEAEYNVKLPDPFYFIP